MCNAWNHSPGCSCGFGEPTQGVAHITGHSEWPEDVEEEPKLLVRGLHDLGWPSTEIRAFKLDAGAGLVAPHRNVAGRIRTLLLQYEFEVITEWTETVHVPLFRFSAPSIPGAKVTYREAEATTTQASLMLKVFGVGTGASATLEVERVDSYVAEAGDCKIVVVPIRMRITHVRTLREGVFVGDGIRAEVIVPKTGNRQLLRARGCRSLSASACREPGNGALEDQIIHDLTSDATGSIHELERRWKLNYANEVSLMFKGVAQLGPLVRSARKSEVGLLLHLPAGYSYRAQIFRDRLLWQSPNGRTTVTRTPAGPRSRVASKRRRT
jgi:hypothetical protein